MNQLYKGRSPAPRRWLALCRECGSIYEQVSVARPTGKSCVECAGPIFFLGKTNPDYAKIRQKLGEV